MRLDRKHVNGRAQQLFLAQRFGQRLDFYHGSARRIDENAARLHGGNLGRADHPLRGRSFRHMQAHHVRLRQQFVQLRDLACIAQRQLGDHVKKHHLHAQRLGQHRELRADGAITHDAQRLAANLIRVFSRLQPAAAMRHRALLGHAAQQQDRLGQHQLGHRAGVGIGCIEHRNAALARRRQVDLIGAYAKAAHGNQL